MIVRSTLQASPLMSLLHNIRQFQASPKDRAVHNGGSHGRAHKATQGLPVLCTCKKGGEAPMRCILLYMMDFQVMLYGALAPAHEVGRLWL